MTAITFKIAKFLFKNFGRKPTIKWLKILANSLKKKWPLSFITEKSEKFLFKNMNNSNKNTEIVVVKAYYKKRYASIQQQAFNPIMC